MVKKLTLAACVAALAVGANAEEAPDPHKPTLILQPPDWVEAPAEMPSTPEDAQAIFIQTLDANGNGMIEMGELEAWIAGFHMPPPEGEGEHVGEYPGDHPGDMGEHVGEYPGEPGLPDHPGDHPGGDEMGAPIDADSPEFADFPAPEACSDDLRNDEMGPQATNVPCGTSFGNEVHRTICNVEGYDWQAISLPAGREASCFGLAAVKGQVAFEIVKESDGTVVWDVYMGKAAYESLVLEGGEIYQVKMLPASSSDARVTVTHNDHPASTVSMEGEEEE